MKYAQSRSDFARRLRRDRRRLACALIGTASAFVLTAVAIMYVIIQVIGWWHDRLPIQ